MAETSPAAGTLRLALKIFLVCLLAVAVAAGAAAAVRLLAAGAEPPRPAAETVSRGWGAFTAEQADRYARLGLAGRLLAGEAALRTVLRGTRAGAGGEEGGAEAAEALTDLLLQRRDELGYDFALVLDPGGRIVAASDRPDLVGVGLGSQALVARALEEGSAAGVWPRGDGRLAHAAVEWVAPEFDLLGYVLVGLDLDEVLALEVQRTSGAGTAFLIAAGGDGPRPVGSSLDAVATEALAAELGGDGRLAEVLASGDTREGVEVTLGDARWEALLAPLRGAGGAPVGAVVIAAPAAAGGGVDDAWLWLAAGVLAALLLGLLLALLLARSTLAPVGRLAGLVDAAQHEGYARRPEPRRAGHLAPLAAALGRLFRDLQEERTLAAAASAAGEHAADPAAGAEEVKVALLGVDLRRYARLGAGTAEARETAERLGRDEARVRALAAARSGRFAGAAGHRLLVAFEGEEAAWDAVATGAAVLAALAERDSAFDEGEPPAVAVAAGRVATGGAAAGAHSAFVVGPAVQLVESLLREAAPGDLVMPRPVHAKVEERLRQAGAGAEEQRGLLSPQPLFVLHETAARRLAAGAAEAAGTAAGGATPAGAVLEDRFEVLEPRGGSGAGELLLARDRELGREVAVKRLPTAALRHPEAAAADGPLAAVRRFTHPGVAELLDFVDAPGGVLLAREWVGGAPLQEVHDLPLPAALGLARQLAAALAAVHDAGLVHGRVKAENLVLVPGLGARLTDLGVGLLAGPGPSGSAGGRLLAPEQRDGRLGGAAADVYAFGALVARLAAGRWWSGEDGEPGATADRTLPDGLEALLRRCLAAEPEARPADGGALLDALASISV